jgi:hypothetical protein
VISDVTVVDVRSLGLIVVGACLSSLGIAGCGGADGDDGSAAVASGIVDVQAFDYRFHAADEIPSGWTTFRMDNVGREHHLLLLYRLPENVRFDDYLTLEASFENVLQALDDGAVESDEALALLRSALPDWSREIVAMGGPGLVAPGSTAITSVRLEPGRYVMECSVRTADGRTHTSLGMVRLLTVTKDSSHARPPAADVELTLRDGAFHAAGSLHPGLRTVAVHFAGSPPDVHLARVTDDTDRDRLAHWLNLLQADGMREPAPADFLGGANGMPVGHTSYFTVDLTPGRYSWVSEPAPNARVLREFIVH